MHPETQLGGRAEPQLGRRAEDGMVNQLYATIIQVSSQVATLVVLSEENKLRLEKLDEATVHLDQRLTEHMEAEEREKEGHSRALESHRNLLAQQVTMLAEVAEKVDATSAVLNAFHKNPDGTISFDEHASCMAAQMASRRNAETDRRTARNALISWAVPVLATAVCGGLFMWFDAKLQEMHKTDHNKTMQIEEKLKTQQTQNEAILEALQAMKKGGR